MKKFLILWLVVMAGCGRSITDVNVDELVMENRVPMDPVPSIYPVWYAEVEACLAEFARTPLTANFKTEGNYSAINWYTATSLTMGDRVLGGVVQTPNNITIKADQVLNMRILRHEMAHHIIGNREIHFENGTRAVCDSDDWREDAETSFEAPSLLLMEVTNDNTIP